ncbi:helix-turn-helix domain-containing protein [Hungatella hathewayi]|uniref:helix-turn-helix domain-containing protein n=1 Tax=Hungatella hathewayi TaxID=154046 RepID=UPI00210A341D|nr:helix-turn-helix transcriptional regulator [Hungatella hathewayi]MCQ5385644.1 helix-turn-helix domain-containing protein [Hungatella hathewayi]
MLMNTVIREKRKELGLTQEKVAVYLGVSAPAVNKWEKGITCPDVSVLPALARLLKTDLNTLLCFKEELTEQEIAGFCTEVAEAVRADGMSAGIRLVREKVQEYPACGALIHRAAMILDGAWFIKGSCSGEREAYADEILSLYERAAECGDEEVSTSARFMLASKYMVRMEYDKSQRMLDLLPENNHADKRQIQANLYIRQEKLDEAARLMERTLMMRLNELMGVLLSLAEIAVKEGRPGDATDIGERWKVVAEQMGLWNYNGLVIALQAALDQEDTEQSLRLIKELLKAAEGPWEVNHSPLFCHIPVYGAPETYTKQIIPPILYEFENSEKCSFLQDNREFKQLIEQYRKQMKDF